ncbi:hypothetical protein BC828DRAFT_303455 [Blastocladiella britannica]|nr:hypothetical protein BC828DRAFT_303455 [Blastocladiella britannica]
MRAWDNTIKSSPRLRPILEAIQLLALYLRMGKLDQFMDVTRRLAAALPLLTATRAPVSLWVRLGLEDRDAMCGLTSSSHDIEWGGMEITLPIYWATMAAADGCVSVLEYLVGKLGLEAEALTAYLSLCVPTTAVLKTLVQHASADGVMPTWRWLVAHGYHYPEEDCGPLTAFIASSAAEYNTVRTLFFEHDKSRILAVTDLVERLETYQDVVYALWNWTVKGHYDLFPELAKLRLLTPRNTFPYLAHAFNANDYVATTLPLIKSLSPWIDGGMDAIVDFGSCLLFF